MKTQIQKWGNSLAVRIPKAFAEEIGLREESLIELTIHEGQLVLSPMQLPDYDLDEMLAQVTDENIHGEIDTGDPMGKEVW